MKLPAVTLCLASLLPFTTNATLDESLYNCSISGTDCTAKDFYSFKTRSSYSDIITCYVLNGIIFQHTHTHCDEFVIRKNCMYSLLTSKRQFL